MKEKKTGSINQMRLVELSDLQKKRTFGILFINILRYPQDLRFGEMILGLSGDILANLDFPGTILTKKHIF